MSLIHTLLALSELLKELVTSTVGDALRDSHVGRLINLRSEASLKTIPQYIPQRTSYQFLTQLRKS